MDRNVSEHEQIIEKLFNESKIDNIMNEMEENGLNRSEVYNSAW
jgi:hypothetical protein